MANKTYIYNSNVNIMEDIITLTAKERLSYALQLRILEKLSPDDDTLKNLKTAIEEGYTIHYQDLFEILSNELSLEDCRFVLDVLEMYRGLIFSALQINETDIVNKVKFRGFDFNDNLEARMASYARNFVFDLRRYDEIKTNSNGDFSSHMIMQNKYQRMLSIWKEYEYMVRYHLSKEQIESILNA